MSVDFVALFIGKALAGSLKKEDEQRLLIVSSVQETSSSPVGFVTAKV